MRLTDIKLSGFKSFVDPTHISVPGQLVGVVGPNGCGKSNIIDAVRWVLGESSARHLRGETMQDVIFNGSVNRKPIGRASVELIFDNSLGKVGGSWAQYAEISVKRVLQRDGDSAYYINNLHVRRRDVADIFLGTGLGGHAYAIIEQGMISRIVEAKPEEIRVFLEEAAGVSKYKERRHETELRVSDTRKNLLRVDDILGELDKQLVLLQEQAAVAEKYRELKGRLDVTQNLFWLLKKQDANALQARFARDIERLAVELEAEIANQREIEKRLEQCRAEHFTVSDALQLAQSEIYHSNAEISRLEQNIQFLRENWKRTEAEISSAHQQYMELQSQCEVSEASKIELQAETTKARDQVACLSENLAKESTQFPFVEAAFHGFQAIFNRLQKDLLQVEQAIQIEDTKRGHGEKMLLQLEQRLQRISEEQQELALHDTARLPALHESRHSGLQRLTLTREQVQSREIALAELLGRISQHEEQLTQLMQKNTETLARMGALRQIQSRLVHGEKTQTWLAKHRFSELPRLWQNLKIDEGWEDALEAILRERLNGIALTETLAKGAWLQDTPPEKVTLYNLPSDSIASEKSALPGLELLQKFIQCKDVQLQSLLAEWLHQVYVVPSTEEALRLRANLPSGAKLVTSAGHIFNRYSVSFHAPDTELHHVLSRQSEIEQLQVEVTQLAKRLLEKKSDLFELQMEKERAEALILGLREDLATIDRDQYKLELEIQQSTEYVEKARLRGEQAKIDLSDVNHLIEQESRQKQDAIDRLARYQETASGFRVQVPQAQREFETAEQALNGQRVLLRTAENELQQAIFHEKSCSNKYNELEININVLHERISGFMISIVRLQGELASYNDAPLNQELQDALVVRATREQKLKEIRERLENIIYAIQQIEFERLAVEQKLQPLRDRIAEARLKEQEARLLAEQYGNQLSTIAEDELMAMLPKGARPNNLQSQVDALTQEIIALGAVNLAALDQLHTSRERKAYLDTQALDLKDAIATLEDAIRRIDLETRERLQKTFDTVNENLEEMFSTLFAGGHASLLLTGAEILDSGVQIIAQPPGKKNASIQLLSGGEKALCALALVFSLFKLNPAPFCLLDEVDAPLDDHNTERYCELVKKLSSESQFLFISHNKITMEMAEQLIGVTMQELGVSRVVAVDMEQALKIKEEIAA